MSCFKYFIKFVAGKDKINLLHLNEKMTYTDRYLVETYTGLFEGLSSSNKMELIENLSKSLKVESNTKDAKFYKAFGAFSSEKSAEEIINNIKLSRKFRNTEIKL